jgi:hypothetical protein
MTPDYKNKSETWLAVAIISAVFVGETSTTTRFHYNNPTKVMMVLLAITFVVSIVQWVRFRALWKRHPQDT